MNVVDILRRYKSAFGYMPVMPQLQPNERREVSGVQVYVHNNVSFADVRLIGNGFDVRFGAMPMLTGAGGQVQDGKLIAPPPMIGLSKQKNITFTPVNGSDGGVVENYGHQEWEINWQGIIVDMTEHNYPATTIRTLRAIFDTDAQYDVICPLLNDLSIDSIYFTGINIGGIEGYADTLQYTLNAKSIKPIEFQIKT